MSSECPWSVPRLCPADMDPRKDLEALVAMVAILGELAATVTAPHKDVWPLLYPKSLHRDLSRLIWFLQNTLDNDAVISVRQGLAILRATPRPTKADVTTAERVWRESVNTFEPNWDKVYVVAMKIFCTLEDEDTAEATNEAINKATNEDPAEATATSLARDLWDKIPPGQGTAGDSLVATAPQPSVALPSAMVPHDAPVAAATEGREEPVVATRQVEVATSRGQQVKEARELLGRFTDLCVGGTEFPWDLDSWLDGLEGSEEWTEEKSPDDPEAVLAQAKRLCGAEWMWEASARLTKDHLLVIIEEIHKVLWSPCGNSGGPGGPFGRAVAEQCQKAMEDIPRLLGVSEVTNVTSQGQ
ncbi:uncharacterized protein [Sylvia atricapilla]|uniref:uncharacterized protein n=1 Tax=Sylvia atricapilla TaxID=48155 RepID=UPI003397313C